MALDKLTSSPREITDALIAALKGRDPRLAAGAERYRDGIEALVARFQAEARARASVADLVPGAAPAVDRSIDHPLWGQLHNWLYYGGSARRGLPHSTGRGDSVEADRIMDLYQGWDRPDSLSDGDFAALLAEAPGILARFPEQPVAGLQPPPLTAPEKIWKAWGEVKFWGDKDPEDYRREAAIKAYRGMMEPADMGPLLMSMDALSDALGEPPSDLRTRGLLQEVTEVQKHLGLADAGTRSVAERYLREAADALKAEGYRRDDQGRWYKRGEGPTGGALRITAKGSTIKVTGPKGAVEPYKKTLKAFGFKWDRRAQAWTIGVSHFRAFVGGVADRIPNPYWLQRMVESLKDKGANVDLDLTLPALSPDPNVQGWRDWALRAQAYLADKQSGGFRGTVVAPSTNVGWPRRVAGGGYRVPVTQGRAPYMVHTLVDMTPTGEVTGTQELPGVPFWTVLKEATQPEPVAPVKAGRKSAVELIAIMDELHELTGDSLNTAVLGELEDGSFPTDRIPGFIEGLEIWRDQWVLPALDKAAEIRSGEETGPYMQVGGRDVPSVERANQVKAASVQAGNDYWFPGFYLVADAAVERETAHKAAQIEEYLKRGVFPGNHLEVKVVGFGNGRYTFRATIRPTRSDRWKTPRVLYARRFWVSEEQAHEKLREWVNNNMVDEGRMRSAILVDWGNKPPTVMAAGARAEAPAVVEARKEADARRMALQYPVETLKSLTRKWAQAHKGWALAQGVGGVFSEILRELEAGDDKELAEALRKIPQRKQDEVVGDVLAEMGELPYVWSLSFEDFLNRRTGITYPGWPHGLKREDWTVPGAKEVLEAAEREIDAPVKAAVERVRQTAEGRGALAQEASGHFRSWDAPKGKKAAQDWARYKEAEAEAAEKHSALRPYALWVWWMTLRDLARKQHKAVPQHDETPPAIPGADALLPGTSVEALAVIGPEAGVALIEALKQGRGFKAQKVYDTLGSMNKGQRGVLEKLDNANTGDHEVILFEYPPNLRSVNWTLSDAQQRSTGLRGWNWATPAQLAALIEGGWIDVELFRDETGPLGARERFHLDRPLADLGDGTWWRLGLGAKWREAHQAEAKREAEKEEAEAAWEAIQDQPATLWPLTYDDRYPKGIPASFIGTAWDLRRLVAGPERWGINGLYWGPSMPAAMDGKSALVATNGWALAACSLPFAGGSNKGILPVENATSKGDSQEVREAVKALPTTGETTSTLAWLREPITQELLQSIPRVDGDFPDYLQVIPNDDAPTVGATLSVKALRDFLWQAGNRSSRAAPASRVGKFASGRFMKEGIIYMAPERGVKSLYPVEWAYPSTWNDQDWWVGFDATLLGGILQICDSDAPLQIRIGTERIGRGKARTSDPVAPIQLWQEGPSGGIRRLFILMPMRLD